MGVGSKMSKSHAARAIITMKDAAQQNDRVAALRVTRFMVNLPILDEWNPGTLENKMPRTGRSFYTSNDVVMAVRLRSNHLPHRLPLDPVKDWMRHFAPTTVASMSCSSICRWSNRA